MSFSLYPIPHAPALWIQDLKMLVLADLHIGIENELKKHGVQVPSQTIQMKKKLYYLCSQYEPETIILLGDIKHSIPATPFQEKNELYDFLKGLANFASIHIIPGNHDGSIKHFIPDDIILHPSGGYLRENIGFIHGHRWPKKSLMHAEFLFFGHSHPTIMLSDRLKYQNFEPCWVKTSLLKETIKKRYEWFNKDLTVLVFPAFNLLCGGTAVNKDGLVGPLQKIIDLPNAEIFLLDGTNLGKVKQI